MIRYQFRAWVARAGRVGCLWALLGSGGWAADPTPLAPAAATPLAPAAATASATAAPSSPALTWAEAAVLGLVEGITEFLPVSSTGHLILASALLDLPLEENPNPDTAAAPGAAAAVKAYLVAIQGGAIAAVLLLYWPSFRSILAGLAGRDPAGRQLLVNLLAAFCPAAVAGLLLHDWIESRLFGPGPVLLALVAGAGLILVEERRRSRLPLARAARGLADLSIRESAAIGLCQVVALWPGTSRSLMAILGGYWVGLSPRASAEFSFLLGFVTLGAASGYSILKDGSGMLTHLSPGPLALGALLAMVSAALAVRGLVGWLQRHGLAVFAWYRLGLAAVLACAWW